MPSVVSIATTAKGLYRDPYLDFTLSFWGKRAPVIEGREGLESIGSGVIIDESGYVVTSYHVVSNEYLTRLQVKLAGGEVYDAEPCVGTTLKDIALLRIKAPDGTRFPAIKFAQDDDLILGESVVALGNPYGLGGSATSGILSSKNRRPSAGNEELDVRDWLQTDAGINPGNSGGPLINMRGEMIGINARVMREGEGMGVGFTIPVKQISAALSDFFTPEAANACWFGARVGSFNAPLTVTRVQANSPADQAGLEVGQRILKVNGSPPRTLVDFHRLATSRQDLKVDLEVETRSSRRSLKVVMIPFRDLLNRRLGAMLRRLSKSEAESLNIKASDALVLEQVQAQGPAAQAGLRAGLLVMAMDDHKTASLMDAAGIVSGKTPGEQLKVTLAAPSAFGVGFSTFTATLEVR